MRKRRGLSLIELLIGMSLMLGAMLGFSALFTDGMRSMMRTNADVTVGQQNAQGLRRMSETLRESMSTTISSDGTLLTYTLPRRMTTTDLDTGERELVIPLQSDGTARSFRVTNGQLVDQTGKVLVRNIMATDPDPTSTQFNQTYAPFSYTTIGATRAISINLITSQNVRGERRFARMKTTVLLRNTP